MLELLANSSSVIEWVVFMLVLFFLRGDKPSQKLVVSVVIMGLMSIGLRYGLNQLASVEVFKALLRFGWYLAFAILNLLGFFWIFALSISESLVQHWTVRTIIACYFFKGSLMVARYIDRFVIETDALGLFYQVSLTLAVFILSLSLALFVVLRLIKVHQLRPVFLYRNKR